MTSRSDSRTIQFNSETSLHAFLMTLSKDTTFHVEEVVGKPGRYVLYLD
jgi:hypothetical protein